MLPLLGNFELVLNRFIGLLWQQGYFLLSLCKDLSKTSENSRSHLCVVFLCPLRFSTHSSHLQVFLVAFFLLFSWEQGILLLIDLCFFVWNSEEGWVLKKIEAKEIILQNWYFRPFCSSVNGNASDQCMAFDDKITEPIPQVKVVEQSSPDFWVARDGMWSRVTSRAKWFHSVEMDQYSTPAIW